MTRALTPKYCLKKMAAALSAMEEAQDRYAEISGAYAGTQAMPTLDDIAAGDDPRLRSAAADTGYYQCQADTWANAATALLAGLNRYSPRPTDLDDAGLRDAHLNLESLPLTHGVTGDGWAINGRSR